MNIWESVHEPMPIGCASIDPGLLQNHLRKPRWVRFWVDAPWQFARMLAIPSEQLYRERVETIHGPNLRMVCHDGVD